MVRNIQCHQIKILMANRRPGKLKGKVQIDESYFGMKMANKHKRERAEYHEEDGTRIDNKTGVMGFLSVSQTIIKSNLR